MVEALPMLDAAFARMLTARKADFVGEDNNELRVAQQGAARIETSAFPGWVAGLTTTHPVIETYVASDHGVAATSDNQPFVDAWMPLVSWVDLQVRAALETHQVQLVGDAYVTASLTATSELEGLAHMDDDTFTPDAPVGIVAIIGEWAGPRIATTTVPHEPLRPMSQVVFSEATLADFADGTINHAVCSGDQLVIFAQFGQLHAGPAAAHIADRGDFRQLIVYRAQATRT